MIEIVMSEEKAKDLMEFCQQEIEKCSDIILQLAERRANFCELYSCVETQLRQKQINELKNK